jgi:hypothetical protein
MNKYQDGKIYRIIGGDKVYVGSTTHTINERYSKHKSCYNSFQKGNYGKCMAFDIFDEFGVDACSIELVEDYPCSSKRDLEERERHWIQTLECVNKVVPTRTDKEYYQDNRDARLESTKQYRDSHKDELQKYQKEYRDSHKEYIAEKNKEWRDANREELLQKKKEYYERTKDIDIEARKKRQREAQQRYRDKKKADALKSLQ